MPVRFLIYIAITALTRLLISDIQHDHKADMDLVYYYGFNFNYGDCNFGGALCIVELPFSYLDKHADKPSPEGKHHAHKMMSSLNSS